MLLHSNVPTLPRFHTTAHPRTCSFISRTVELPSFRAIALTRCHTSALPKLLCSRSSSLTNASLRSQATSPRSCAPSILRSNNQTFQSSHAETVVVYRSPLFSRFNTPTLSPFQNPTLSWRCAYRTSATSPFHTYAAQRIGAFLPPRLHASASSRLCKSMSSKNCSFTYPCFRSFLAIALPAIRAFVSSRIRASVFFNASVLPLFERQ